MNQKKLIKKTYYLILLIALFIAGCGYNPEEAVYDTKSNPNNFPKVALELLDNIENNSFESQYDIVEGFVRVYTQEQSLLDNPNWKDIIEKIGTKFRYQADLMVKSGIDKYTRASETYTLAAFARPSDKKISKLNKSFVNWEGEQADSLLSINNQVNKNGITHEYFEKQLFHLKNFMFQDSSKFKFGQQYLSAQLFGDLVGDSKISEFISDSLSLPDRLFLASIHMSREKFDSTVVSFENNSISLLGFDILKGKDNFSRAEFYFVANEKIEKDFKIAFWVDEKDSILISNKTASTYFPYDFSPWEKTSTWKKGQVMVAVRHFDYQNSITEISIGLYTDEDGNVSYLPILFTGDSLSNEETTRNIIKIPLSSN